MQTIDESEVTSPVSLMEWFSNFYASTQFPDDPADRPLEGICREGEIMFVPRGWWHAVVNLEDCIAITQNYVGSQNLKETMEFLYMKRDQVSGVADDRREGLYEEFKEAFFRSNWTPPEDGDVDTPLQEGTSSGDSISAEEIDRKRSLMEMWEKNEQEIEQLSKAVQQRCKGGVDGSEQLSFWEMAKRGTGGAAAASDKEGESGVEANGGSGGGFSFSFGFTSDDEEDEEEPVEEEPLGGEDVSSTA